MSSATPAQDGRLQQAREDAIEALLDVAAAATQLVDALNNGHRPDDRTVERLHEAYRDGVRGLRVVLTYQPAVRP